MAELPRLRVGLTLDSATFVRETNKVVDSVNRMNRDIVRQNQQMARSFEGIERSVGSVASAVRAFGAIIGIGSIAALGKQIIQTADAFTVLSGRLNVVSGSAEEAAAAQEALIGIARRNRTSIEDTAELYTRLALTLRDAGVESDTLLAVTETVGQALKIGGGNAAAASAGIVQFAQAMGSGVLRGQELNSILEQVPGLAKAIADGLGVPIGQLRRLGEQGELTTERVLNALLKQAPQIEAAFSDIPITVSDAMQQLRNSFATLVGDADSATSASRELAGAISDLANMIGSSEVAASFQRFIVGFLGEMRARLQTTREEFDRLVNAFSVARDFLSQFRLADPQSLDAINNRIADINENLARLTRLNREAAGDDTQVAVRTAIIEALRQEREELVQQRAALQSTSQAQEQTTQTTGALTLSILGQSEAIQTASGETAKLTNQQKRLAEAGRILLRTSAQEERFDIAQEQAAKLKEIDAQILRSQEVLASRQIENAQRAAEESAVAWNSAMEGAVQSIQSTFTDTFEEIYSGGVTTFSDLASEIKDIFIRLAAELTTLMIFRPVLQSQLLAGGAGGLFGAGGAAGAAGAAGVGTAIIPAMAPAAAGGVAGWTQGLAGGAGAFGKPPQISGWTQGLIGGVPAYQPRSWWLTPQRGLTSMFAAGGLGLLGGSLIGGQFGGAGGIGGGFGGAAGAAAGLAFGGPLGAIGGGLAGSLLGGGIGSLFGGGGGQSNNVAFGRGALGAVGARGTGAGAGFIKQLDQQILSMLDARMVGLANAALANAENISVKYSKTPSANDLANLARGRIGPTAGALGFRAAAVTGGPGQFTPEQQIGNLQAAITTQETIRDLVKDLIPFHRALADVRERFADIRNEAAKFGISTAGLAEAEGRALQKIVDDFKAQQRALSVQIRVSAGDLSILGGSIEAVNEQSRRLIQQAKELGLGQGHLAAIEKGRVKAIRELQAQFLMEQNAVSVNIRVLAGHLSPLQGEIAEINAQFRELGVQARELGLGQGHLAAIEKGRVKAIRELQAQFLAEQHTLSVEIRVLAGHLAPIQGPIAAINEQFREMAIAARNLGLGQGHLMAIEKARAIAIKEAVQQDRLRRHASLEQIGIYSPLTRALKDLDVQMQLARIEANRLGYSTALVAREQQRLAAEIIRAHEAQVDAMALSIRQPFQEMLDPLREFFGELQFGNLNPAGQMQAAGEEFRRIANLAKAGSTVAIQQIQGAGEAFIAQAERFGASPGGVAARAEVASVIQQVIGSVEQAQRQASAGLENVIRQASQREVDTLHELVAEVRFVAEEIRRNRRV